jgi:hypothetical protein
MRVGVGLTITTPGAKRRHTRPMGAESRRRPFSSPRVLTDCSTTPSTPLAAAAAVTERIRLATMIAIGPLKSAAALVNDAAWVHAGGAAGRAPLGGQGTCTVEGGPTATDAGRSSGPSPSPTHQ